MSNFQILNALLEDTCVIIAIAYLLARGRPLALLNDARQSWVKSLVLSLFLGAVGLTEVIFPGGREPYVTHTLMATFAVFQIGFRVALLTGGIVALGALAIQGGAGMIETLFALIPPLLIGWAARRLVTRRDRPPVVLLSSLITGAIAEAGVLVLHNLAHGQLHRSLTTSVTLSRVLANGFGVLIIQLILIDARTRAESERNRLDAEHTQTLVVKAQLVALRARMHPHFLFNTLNSIAALCRFSPQQALSATIRLSQLMRRILDFDPTTPISAQEELEFVRGYLEIEQNRLGKRLNVVWRLEGDTSQALIPVFSLQTLAENAIIHGISPKTEPGTLEITARTFPTHILFCVRDNGAGMTSERCRVITQSEDFENHGLRIASQQLTLIYGARARIRLFSRPNKGTLAVFYVPLSPPD